MYVIFFFVDSRSPDQMDSRRYGRRRRYSRSRSRSRFEWISNSFSSKINLPNKVFALAKYGVIEQCQLSQLIISLSPFKKIVRYEYITVWIIYEKWSNDVWHKNSDRRRRYSRSLSRDRVYRRGGGNGNSNGSPENYRDYSDHDGGRDRYNRRDRRDRDRYNHRGRASSESSNDSFGQ